jgi:hypothetical protein
MLFDTKARPPLHAATSRAFPEPLRRGIPDMTSFGRRRWLLGHPVPAGELSVPYGRPTGPPEDRAGPRRGFHVPHVQDTTGVGALYSPGTVVLIQADHDHRPAPGASQRRVPAPRHSLHHCAALLHEPSTRVQAIRTVRSSPRPWPADGSPALWLFLELRTPPLRAAHVEAGTDLWSTDPKPALRHQPNLQPRGFT